MSLLKNILSTLIIFSFLATPLMAQQTFEGKIKLSIELKGEGAEQMASFMPKSYDYTIKGEKMKFKINGGMAAAMMGDVILDGNADKVYMVKHSEQTVYTVTNGEETQEAMAPKVTKMDEVVDIQGYKCQKYKVIMSVEEGVEIVQYIWATDKIKIPTPKGNMGMQGSNIIIDGIDGFPLKTEYSLAMGPSEMKMVMTAISVEKGSVDNSEFEIPQNYEQKELDPGSLGN